MNATHLRLSAGHAERSDAPTQAERLLKEMHAVCSHDLPNQMVALQGLLQLLSQEESANLGNEGRRIPAAIAKRHPSGEPHGPLSEGDGGAENADHPARADRAGRLDARVARGLAAFVPGQAVHLRLGLGVRP